MAASFQDAWQRALNIERELTRCLNDKEPTFAEISHFLNEYRSVCQSAILLDFDAARETDVEGRLWDAHLKLNIRFRKQLSRYREENAKRKPVEKRKLERHYLDFIKTSQRFYRGYIQHLSSHFGGIVELEKVARKFSFENLAAQPSTTPSPDLRKRILLSCHSTLIRLGDLSRYRETELVIKDRNWGPAIGYYDLAAVIYPASGASHNQQAVIALADGNHFRATYHLYRALSAQEPHPSAKGNLEIEFRKVMSAWAKRELIRPEDAGIPGRALAPWFVYLHAQCYKGNDFPEHDELESEVMSQLAVDIRERSLEGMLTKFCLVNVAAEAFARVRSAKESVSNACVFFQRINVKTFFTLLQILLVELERFAGEDPNNKDANGYPDKVTVVARRILPALRHYSSWLLTTSGLLVAEKEEKDSALAIQIQEFWKIYAGTLTLLASTFDILHLPEVDYLLEEDEESLGFAPLDQEATVRRYFSSDEKLKPRMDDPEVERNHPNMEMLYRIREFVIDGLDLVVSNKIPVVLVDDEDKKIFIYQEDGLPTQIFSSPHIRQDTLSVANIGREDFPPVSQEPASTGENCSVFDGSQSASASMSANMNRIVEGVERLVESDTYENPPSIPDQFAFLNDTGDIPTPSAQIRRSPQDYSYPEESINPRSTPVAPPGLGPPSMAAAESLRMTLSQSYSPMPTLPSIPNIPNIPNIWNTSSPNPLRDITSPRTPPGLGPKPPLPSTSGVNLRGPDLSPSQGQIPNEPIRHSLMGQTPLANSFDPNVTPPPWMYSSNSSAMQPPPAHSWDRDQLNRFSYTSHEASGQPMSSAVPNQTWANDAFIASSVASGVAKHPPGLGPRKASHLGAIGQTPPCGQGG
ncbi:hypothetical protein N7468_008143 [Penicillium chermesinum]|uniref:Nonsense-mediated mRNA decay factor n=1 Tax=Penicillium chermesinum TaxID=63820 RepID=A0A9W9NPI2_9EURO|nr:uncharacterized protein N7468_008143 [Penicillium chermesinum]KAJ5223601.1 hypothetical protein N7468_008143 [Penicillium chermesinum]